MMTIRKMFSRKKKVYDMADFKFDGDLKKGISKNVRVLCKNSKNSKVVTWKNIEDEIMKVYHDE